MSNQVIYFALLAGLVLVVFLSTLDYYEMGLIRFTEALRIFSQKVFFQDISINEILKYKRNQTSYTEAFSKTQSYHKNLNRNDINLLLSFKDEGK